MSGVKMLEFNDKESVGGGSYIYQNPLVNPSNGIKNSEPSPILSGESYYGENFAPVRKSQRENPYMLLPKEPEGWSEFVDRDTFIQTMFHTVQKEAMEEAAVRKMLDASDAHELGQEKSQEKAKVQSKQTSTRGVAPRRIEIPWKNTSQFASPSALRQKAFDNFNKMSPDPPRTPSAQVGRHARFASVVPRKRAPTANKADAHTVIGPRMQLVPLRQDSNTNIFAKPKSLPLPANKTLPLGPTNLEKAVMSLEKKPPINVQPMISTNNYQAPPPPSTRTIRFDEKPRIPMPLSKRKEFFPQNQPPLYHSVYYSGGKRNPSPMPPQMNVRKVFGIQGEYKTGIGLDKSSTQSQNKNGKGQPARKIRPAMLFPFHVPGPKHDNIYIGDYQGSDSEPSESEQEVPVKK